MVGPWAYGGFEGRHVDRWLSSRAGWSADVLRDGTLAIVCFTWKETEDKTLGFNIKEFRVFKLSLSQFLFTLVVSLPFSSVQKMVLVLDPPPQLALHALHSPATHLET